MNVQNYPFSEAFFRNSRTLITRSNRWMIFDMFIFKMHSYL